MVRLNGLYYCLSIQHSGEFDQWRGKGIQKHCKQFGKAHSHSQVLFNNLWFAAMPTHRFLTSCTTIKSNSKFTIEWQERVQKRESTSFQPLHLFQSYRRISSVEGGGRRMKKGRNFLRGENKLQIACPYKNLSAVSLSKRSVKCWTKDVKAYEQVSVTIREIENQSLVGRRNLFS